MKKVLVFAIMGLAGTALWQCQTSDPSSGEAHSKRFTKRSHYTGENCMRCHGSDTATYTFTVAGTVYKAGGTEPAPNGKVTLYTAPGAQGDVVATIQVDAYGNFYTTQAIDFGSGVYPVVEGFGGARSMMSSKATHGACNSCHTASGQPTDRIEVNE